MLKMKKTKTPDSPLLDKSYMPKEPGLLLGALKSWWTGDFFVKISPIIWFAGYLRRKQFIKSILVALFQLVFVWFTVNFAMPNLQKFDTLGDVQAERYYDKELRQNVWNDFDNSFTILLMSVIAIVVFACVFLVLCSIIREQRDLQRRAKEGKHINTFVEDVKSLFNQKFHITLLFCPLLGILIFTIMPLVFMIAIAFTNYDSTHVPPGKLFTWVGLDNFKNLFNGEMGAYFGYSFTKILGWTLIWSFFATVTNYIGGILLSLLINNKRTKLKKMWRTAFVITIAVPQFVSLLLVRMFFDDTGMLNNFLGNIGVTGFLRDLGMFKTDFIPFLTNPDWAKVMIILINIWIGVPYLMLIATGVIMNIPADLYESAKIDGAGKWKQFTKITMPYMLSVTGPYLVTSFMGNINNFNVIYLLTNDVYSTHDMKLARSNAQEIDLLVTWLYRLTRDGDIGQQYNMASVIGILVFLVCTVITLIAFNWTIGKNREGNFRL